MTDREFAEELQRRVKALRAFRKESDDAEARVKAAEEARDGARAAAKALRDRWRAAADAVRQMTWGTEPLDLPYEEFKW